MTSRSLFRSAILLPLALLFAGVHLAVADSSHARIIRLSLVQGDVRFTRDTHGDPLADQKAVWETAVLNLPVRQGYVLATDNGRAEIEFENGAMAFLNENTVVEFYDLSLTDGARTTRLVLRQGTASFYVTPASSDYFSVTGGDFTVEASGREDSVVTATPAAMQYTSSPYYSSGFGDLYTYGSWYPVAGYGSCWRPYGVGLGWSPFDNGNWFFDPVFGWSFIGYQPWGWLPYHYGGWLFQPGFGWVWVPTGFGGIGRPVPWRPVTAVWVHSGGRLGLVPAHPMDARGKTPLNLAQGVFPVSGRGVSESMAGNTGTNWKVLKQPPRETLTSSVAASGPPARLSRTVISGNTGSRVVTLSKDSSITFDPHEHRFVNNNAPQETRTETGTQARTENSQIGAVASARVEKAGVSTATVTRVPGASTSERASTPPHPARTMTPPPAPRASASASDRGGSNASSSRSSSWSSRSSAPSAPASHPAPAPSGRPH